MSHWLVLTGALVGFSVAAFLAWRIVQAYAVYEGKQVCACPIDGTPALVKLRVWRAALSALRGRASLDVVECSRWPERASCTQGCVPEVEGNCRIMAQFHANLARETGRPWFSRLRKHGQDKSATHWLVLEFPREFPVRSDVWPRLRNVGKQAVRNIHIHPVQRGGFRATFPPIAELVPGGAPVVLRPTTIRDGRHEPAFSSARNDWFAVLFSFDTSVDIERRFAELNVPIRIEFSDAHDNRRTEVKRLRCVRPGMIFDVVNLGQELRISEGA